MILKMKKKAFISLVYVLVCLGGIIVIMGVITTYQHQLIIRNIEAAADLAAVESLRQVIDEDALRNETLLVKPESLEKMRNSFLDKLRTHIPSASYAIEKIEIPTVNNTGNVVFNSKNLNELKFPNSTTNNFYGPVTIVDDGTGIAKTSYFLGGKTSDNCALELSKVNGNLAVSGTKKKEAYVLSTKVTIIFSTTSTLNKLSYSILNHVNILSGNARQIKTDQINRNTVAVTIQTIGEVVLR